MLIGAGTAHMAGDTGGTETVTLTKEQSGLPAHGHGFTQPTVNGGAITKGVPSSGGHSHTVYGVREYNYNTGRVAAYGGHICNASDGSENRTTSSNGSHTHNLPAHTHSVSGGKVSDNSGANATQAHDNMPPYLAVYM